MITTVTLNPAIDKTIILEEFLYGQVNRIAKVREDIGGKGINVSKMLNSLDIDNKAIGFLGKDNINYIKELIKPYGIDNTFIQVSGNTRTNTKIVETNNNTTTDLNESGFFVSNIELEKFEQLIKNASLESDYIVISGSIPRGLNNDIYAKLIKIINKKSKIFVDASGELLLEAIKAGVDIIKPNIHELEEATNKRLVNDDDIVAVCREWIKNYKLTYILVSMGGNGSLLVSEDIVLKAMPVKVDVKSTVGAGDSMVGGFLQGLTKGETITDLESALKIGAACGSVAVTKEGTAMITKEEILEMLEKVTIKNLSKNYNN